MKAYSNVNFADVQTESELSSCGVLSFFHRLFNIAIGSMNQNHFFCYWYRGTYNNNRNIMVMCCQGTLSALHKTKHFSCFKFELIITDILFD